MSDSPSGDRPTISVSVDNDICQGHARCWHLAPDFFTLDDEGYANIGEGKPVPPGMETLVRSGVDACPEHALTIHDLA
jgi:ferredoxin